MQKNILARLPMERQGTETPGHLIGELFKDATGTSLTHIPYRGDPPALTDLMTGQVHLTLSTMAPTVPLVIAEKVRVLAVTSAARIQSSAWCTSYQRVCTGLRCDRMDWRGCTARYSVLHREIVAALASESFKARYAELNLAAMTESKADFEKLIANEVKKWAEVIRAANIRLQ
jgi:tripartite-type tricarboxylate transporter receptor subunit TctC